MVDKYDLRRPDKLTREQLGEVLVEFDSKAQKAEDEAEGHEAKAKSLRCDAKKYRDQAEEVLKGRCPRLHLEVSV